MRRLRTVLVAQALVIVLGITLSAALLVATSVDKVFPWRLAFPLMPVADASPETAAAALKDAFPGDDVAIEDGQVVILFTKSKFDVSRARAVLSGEGFRAERFDQGRDFHFKRFAARMIEALKSVASLLLVMPIVFLASALVLRRRYPPRAAGARRVTAKDVAAGIGAGLALAAAVEGLGALLAAMGRPVVEQPIVEAIARDATGASLAAFIAAAVLLAPLGEELFYRGWVFPYLEDVSLPLAYAASAGLFTAVHFHPPAAPAYLLLGLGLTALYRWSRSIWTPVLAHATNNLIAIATLLLAR